MRGEKIQILCTVKNKTRANMIVMPMHVDIGKVIQSTLVISTSLISKNRLSQRENLVLILTKKSKIRL